MWRAEHLYWISMILLFLLLTSKIKIIKLGGGGILTLDKSVLLTAEPLWCFIFNIDMLIIQHNEIHCEECSIQSTFKRV